MSCHLEEMLHYCWVNLVVLSSTCYDSTNAGRHLLTTVLAKLQSDWVSIPSRVQTATLSLHQSSYIDSVTLRALIGTASGKESGRNTETEATTRAWREGLQKLRLFFYTLIDEDEDGNWWCCRGPFRFETTWQAADHTFYHNYPGVKQAWELWHLQC